MNSRNQSLDVLRGVAILLVMVRHYPTRYLWYVYQLGWTGVDLFFVLSGFLISGLLFAEYKQTGMISVRRFWIRRGFKIYPPFYFLLALTALFFMARAGSVPRELLTDALFVQNYYFDGIWRHDWSLAVEEHFYFALPLLLTAMMFISKRRQPFTLIPALSIFSVLGCLYLRTRLASHGDFLGPFFFTHLRVDALLVGVAISYFHHFKPDTIPRRRWPLALFGGVLLLPDFGGRTMFAAEAGLTLTVLGYACILIAMMDRKPSKNVALRMLAFIGYYSYSIYLWHPALLLLFERFGSSLWLQLLYDCCSVAVGVAMAKLIELPCLKVRDKYFPSVRVEHESRKFPCGADLRSLPFPVVDGLSATARHGPVASAIARLRKRNRVGSSGALLDCKALDALPD